MSEEKGIVAFEDEQPKASVVQNRPVGHPAVTPQDPSSKNEDGAPREG